ncbi:MAG: hypothetical protein ABIG64_00810 [Candidatus Omnitrophota bacterium]
MIEINLLPDEFKVQPDSAKTQKIPVTLILLCANAVLIAILIIVTGINLSRKVTLHSLNKRLKDLASQQQQISTLQQKTTNFKNTNSLFQPFTKNRFLWAKKLNKLSDLVVPGIWLRELAWDKQFGSSSNTPAPVIISQYLKIDATVVPLSHDEMSIVGEFIRNLKKDKTFFDDFKEIKLEGVLRRKISNVEVVDFTIICQFKPEVVL